MYFKESAYAVVGSGEAGWLETLGQQLMLQVKRQNFFFPWEASVLLLGLSLITKDNFLKVN